jgi:putative endonuclease
MDLVRFIEKLSLLWRGRRCGSDAARNPEHELGRLGERLAARHLRRNRHKILYRNFRAKRGGEVDIVCRDKSCGELVFVEVKTRSSTDFGRPADAVNMEKQRLISKGALAWLRLLDNPDIVFRFDIVEVVIRDGKPEFNVIRDAFTLPKPYHY